MKYKFFILFFLFSTAFAETKGLRRTLVGSKEMPLEINLLLESIQKDSKDYLETLLPIVTNIDNYARSLDKEDIFMIGKIEVYKTLLKNYDSPIRTQVDGTSIKTLQSALAKTSDNFLKWFLQALLQDTVSLVNSPAYKEYLLQKSANGKLDKIEYRKLEKKASLLQYWISKISPEDEDFPYSLRQTLIPRLIETLKNVENSFHLLATLGSGVPLKDKSAELKFFSVKDLAEAIAAAAKPKEKSVEEILAPLEKAPATASPSTAPIPDLPKPAEESWAEDENAPSNLKNLPNPSNDADWLQDF